ncbi:DUF1572 family protein [Deinococcus rubellus]|uniref:DUF1572 domain-containing protein n=1 Tax=Deinococcus rubellus TaxID=1889240 RepID=A0ABY5YI71_9DEIO|nr:DUF1572 domain-containing protein [Deinococcus rubellus]UWX63488.1 DUF1572 domain-containing protein [Deinococcus rubellus]
MPDTQSDVAHLYLTDVRTRMRNLKALGEGALVQLTEADWHTVLSDGGNSAAVLVQHLSGNMHSRWNGLRHGYQAGLDGETAGRNRDAEFEDGKLSADKLRGVWDGGWAVFLETLDHLSPADLTRTLSIRGETHTILEAVQRQVMHYSGHIYQLVLLVKTLRGDGWQTLSIGRGGSAAFNASMREKRP